MTHNYARIANRVVADEYAAVTAKVEAFYTTTIPAEAEGPNMARLRTEHHRMLGNGYYTRPPQLDCHYETICGTCTRYQTDLSFQPVLLRQRNHALEHQQDQRTDLYNSLLNKLNPTQPPTRRNPLATSPTCHRHCRAPGVPRIASACSCSPARRAV